LSRRSHKPGFTEADYLPDAAGREKPLVAVISIAWALFQLSLPRLVILDSITVRAIHLAFAMVLVFLTVSITRHKRLRPGDRIHPGDYLLAAVGCLAVLYIVLDWTGITMRSGIPSGRDIAISIVLIVLVLEASRRVIGPALGIIAVVFTVYAFL
jgi:TRAP-type uncharacterized transport system fused permease subunit